MEQPRFGTHVGIIGADLVKARAPSELTKISSATMQNLPPFGIEHSMANQHQSKGRQLPKLMCPTSHARKNLSLDRAYGFDMWAAISAERPNSAERLALAGLVSHGDVSSASSQRYEDALPRTLRDPRLRTHVVVELRVGKHGVSFGEHEPPGGGGTEETLASLRQRVYSGEDDEGGEGGAVGDKGGAKGGGVGEGGEESKGEGRGKGRGEG